VKKKPKLYFNWSSGKDATLALYHLQKEEKYTIDRLLTTMNRRYNRVSMHGLRRALLEQQIASLDIPITTIELPEEPTIEEYNTLMEASVQKLRSEGYMNCGFGDIFLEDLRTFREDKLKPQGVTCHFPLWKRNTKEIISEFIDLGFKAIVICINASLLDESFVGRNVDKDFIRDLPENVDPCGENGEFHTFCYDGPIFKNPIDFVIGEQVYREYEIEKGNKQQGDKNTIGFWFCDLLPIKNR